MEVSNDRREVEDRRVHLGRRIGDRRSGGTRRSGERRRDSDAKRVLVVDSKDVVREGVSSVLERHGMEIIEAHEGHAGLNYLGESPVEAVVLNMFLVDMDGGEFIRELKRKNAGVPIVAIVGRRSYGSADPMAEGQVSGDFKGIRWPVEPDQLVEAVEEVIN